MDAEALLTKHHVNNTENTNLRGSLNKFPDFFRMGTFIDITQMKL